MSKVKICGLKRLEDIEYINIAQPDYIGFVFSQSKRQVSPTLAASLKRHCAENISAVGVFVNEPIPFITELCHNETIDVVQLHGEETAEYITALKTTISVPIIKAIRVRTHNDIQNYPSDYLLFDSFDPNSYGGTGKPFSWTLLPQISTPFFLAGGIHVDNVAEAIQTLHPYCIDVSSGVETDGVKDFDKIQSFIKKVRSVTQ